MKAFVLLDAFVLFEVVDNLLQVLLVLDQSFGVTEAWCVYDVQFTRFDVGIDVKKVGFYRLGHWFSWSPFRLIQVLVTALNVDRFVVLVGNCEITRDDALYIAFDCLIEAFVGKEVGKRLKRDIKP